MKHKAKNKDSIIALATGIAIGVIIAVVFFGFMFKTSSNDLEDSRTKDSKEVIINMNVSSFKFEPEVIEVVEGTKVIINIEKVSSNNKNVFGYHSFTIGPPYNIHQILEVGKKYRIEFVADRVGEFQFECAVFCGSGHTDMKGKLVVLPKSSVEKDRKKVPEESFLNIEDINKTLRVFSSEESLQSYPLNWNPEDFMYLMAVIQTELPGGAIKVLNTKTLNWVGEIEGVGSRVHVIEFNPKEKRWIYSISRDGLVSKIDLYSMQVVRQIKIGMDSRGLAVSYDGKYIAAGNYNPNTLVILNSETLEPVSVIETAGINPDGFFVKSRVANVFSIEDKKLFAINLKEAGQTWFIEQKPPFRIIKSISTGRLLHEINALDENEKFIVITSQKDNKYVIIDTDKLEIVNTLKTSETPHPGQGTLDLMNKIWYGNSVKEANITLIDSENMQLIGYVWPYGINVSAGGGLFSSPIPPSQPGSNSNKNIKYIVFDIVFGENKGNLFLVDREKVRKGLLGAKGIAGIIDWKKLGFEKKGRIIHPEYSYDGKYLVMSGWDFNKVIIIDADSLPEVKIVKMLDAVTPTGIFPAWRTKVNYLG